VRRLSFARRLVIAGIASFVVVFGVGLLGISKAPATPFDEATHMDYLFKVADGHIPQILEPYGQKALSIWACDDPRGAAWAALEPCGSPTFSPGLAPFGGQSTATGYTPTYYVLSAIPYRICEAVTNWQARPCARTANLVWLSAAASGFTVLILLLGQGLVVAILSGIGLCLIPSVLLQGITFNPDAAVHAVLPWLAVLALALSRSRWKPSRQILVLCLASLIAITLKETALVGAFLIFVFFAYAQVSRLAGRERLVRLGWLALAFTAVLVGVVANQKFQLLWRGQGLVDHMNASILTPPDQIMGVLGTAFWSVLGPFNQLVWGPLAGGDLQNYVGVLAIVTWAMVLQIQTLRAGPEGPVELPARRRLPTSFAPLALIVAITLPIVLTYALWRQSGLAPVQPRYYMGTAAVLFALGVGSTRNRYVGWFAAACLTFLSVAVVRSLLAA